MQFSKTTMKYFVDKDELHEIIINLYNNDLYEYEGLEIRTINHLSMNGIDVFICDNYILLSSTFDIYAIRDCVSILKLKPFSYAIEDVNISIRDLGNGVYPKLLNNIATIKHLPLMGIMFQYMVCDWVIDNINGKIDRNKLYRYLDTFPELPFMHSVIIEDTNIFNTSNYIVIVGTIFNRYNNIQMINIGGNYYKRDTLNNQFNKTNEIYNYIIDYILKKPSRVSTKNARLTINI